MAAGGYTVQHTGETLRSVAQSVWGDASLWYKLADANGMTSDMALSEGQHLTLPAGVSRTRNTASTLIPYNPNDAIGNVSPTTPQPESNHHSPCGVFGQILLVIIAIAVTIWASPAALANITLIQGVIAGVAGSVASQAVGLATGIQQKFDFKGLALLARQISLAA